MATTQGHENFEANKVSWVQNAAKVIADIAFRHVHKNSPSTEKLGETT
jgi:hypothetical protein